MPRKKESIDHRFALVDQEDQLRFPYRKVQQGAQREGFVVGSDRHRRGVYLDRLEDVIRAVVFEHKSVRVTDDPPSAGKGSNSLKLHAKRNVKGYVIAAELQHLVRDADLAPLGTPEDFQQNQRVTGQDHDVLWTSIEAARQSLQDIEDGRLELYLPGQNWSTVRTLMASRSAELAPLPVLIATSDTAASASWAGDVVQVRTRVGPSAWVELEHVCQLDAPIQRGDLRNLHTGKVLDSTSLQFAPCIMTTKSKEMVRQRLPAPSIEDQTLSVEARGADAELANDPLAIGLPETTRKALANARVGQGGYRARMLKLWGSKCAATGCAIERVLVASHAQPWATSSNHARLDEYNGLLLAASVDRLFDAGLIAFRDDGHLLVSEALNDGALASIGLARNTQVRLKP
jgi:hypothetical protein